MTKIKHPFRDTELTRHHIVNKIRGGKSKPSNLLNLWRDRHTAFHHLFHNYSIPEIINHWQMYKDCTEKWEWKLLFHNLTFEECKKLLQRVNRIKRKLPRKEKNFQQGLPL